MWGKPVLQGSSEEDRGLTGLFADGQLPVDERAAGAQGAAAQPRRALLQRVLEIGVSLGFLALALRGISFAQLWAALREAQWAWLIPCVLITVGLLVVKAWRWQLLFLPDYRLPYRPVFAAQCAGYLASNVLPARAGELVRLVLLVSEVDVSAARTLSTIVVERLLDVLSLLLLMVLLLPFVSLPEWMTRSAQVLGVAALLGSAAIVVLSFWKARLLRLSHAMLGRIRFLDRPGVYAAIGHLIDGFAVLRGRRGLFLLALSLFTWFGVVAEAWTAGMAVGLTGPLTAIALSVVVVSLGMVVPSSPGYVGVFHYLVIVALTPFDVPRDLALSYALVWHATNYLVLSLSGLIALWAHGTSLGQVLHRWRTNGVAGA
jgi:glycosyltransferase 2 family protein